MRRHSNTVHLVVQQGCSLGPAAGELCRLPVHVLHKHYVFWSACGNAMFIRTCTVKPLLYRNQRVRADARVRAWFLVDI